MSRFALSRRSTLALMGGAAAFGLTGRIAHAASEIKVLNWQGYGTDEKWALEMFEKRPASRSSMTISTPSRRC
jgi:spermidine/putrescine-binding protein